MRIAQLAPLVESVPPDGYGGTELVVSLLTDELVEHGHEVTLFASSDSRTRANLVGVVPEGLRRSMSKFRYRWTACDLKALLKLRSMSSQFDIVHNHMGYQALPFLETLNCPVVSTNHNPVSEYCRDIYFAFAGLPYVAISNAYRRLNFPDKLNYAATIYNGINIARYQTEGTGKREYLLFVGRVCADKGTAVAIDIARKLGKPIKIAGKVDQTDEEYFLSEVKPKLCPPGVVFLGEVGEPEKVKLYRRALALVLPLSFDEPFGLAMAEALASGTPVMAFDRGSVRELVSDGETGILGRTVDELVARFGEVEHMSANACRLRARNLFSKERMVKDYESLYARLAQ